MPGDDFKGDHDEFVEDQGREADADHAGAIFGHEELRRRLDDAALVDGHGHPDEEGRVGEGAAGGEFLVEFRVEVGEVLVDVFVKPRGRRPASSCRLWRIPPGASRGTRRPGGDCWRCCRKFGRRR